MRELPGHHADSMPPPPRPRRGTAPTSRPAALSGARENIITRIVPSVQQWLPGASILAVASGGGEGVSYGHGLVLGAVYLAVAIAAAMTVFLRSDVTA